MSTAMKMTWNEKMSVVNMFSRIKEIMKLMKKRRFFLTLAFFEILRGFMMMQGEAWGIKWITEGTITKDSSTLLMGIGLLTATVVAATIGVTLIEYFSMNVLIQTMSDIRKLILQAVTRAEVTNAEDFQTGDLIYRLSNNVPEVAQLYRSIYFFIGSFGKVVGSLGVGFILSWKLSILVICLGLLKIWADKTLVKRLQDIISNMKSLESKLVKDVLEYIKGSAFFRIFGNEDTVHDQFMKVNEQFTSENLKEARVEANTNTIMKFFEFITILALLTLGTLLVQKGQTAIGSFTAFIALYDNLINPYKFIGNFLKEYKRYSVSYERVNEVLQMQEEKLEEVEMENHALLQHRFALNVNHVSFSYTQGKKVLDQVNFEAKSGEVTYIIGKSGIGKTTLFKALMGFCKPSDGQIYITANDHLRLQMHKDYCTYISQNAFLFNGTIKENIALQDGTVDQEKVIQAAKKAGIHTMITQLSDGYDTVITDGGKQLSGGERCRMALARVFYNPTPIILLDEVFASLDNNTIDLLQTSINSLCTENRCVLFISHRHEWIQTESKVVEITA